MQIWRRPKCNSRTLATFAYGHPLAVEPALHQIISKHKEKGTDSNKTMHNFSTPLVQDIEKLLPVLITYGTRDYCAPFNDYLRVELIRAGKKHVDFRAYPGLEHNYFGFKPNGELDYDNFNWDWVAADWQHWLDQK